MANTPRYENPPFKLCDQLNRGYSIDLAIRHGIEDTPAGWNSCLARDLQSNITDDIYPYLWLVATKKAAHIDPLHVNLVKRRAIVTAEHPKLHLVWFYETVYIKPLPDYLLNYYGIWREHIPKPPDQPMHARPRYDKHRAALGFLRSYSFLIQHESDFIIAQRANLLPKYRELPWNYLGQLGQTSQYLQHYAAPLIFIFAILTLILTSMQVVLAALGSNTWEIFVQVLRCHMALIIPLLFMVAAILALRVLLRKYISTRLGPNYAPKSEFGLVPIEKFGSKLTADGVDIIFVHGLGSNPDTTWKAKSTNTPRRNRLQVHLIKEKDVDWITEFLYEDLPSNIRSGIRVFFYNYDSYWCRDAIRERRSRLGRELSQAITTMGTKTPDRSIVFVGHSYGGLVIKEAIIDAHDFQSKRSANTFKQIKAVMFLGTPHRGSPSAWLGTKVARLFRLCGLNANPDIVEALMYDSPDLQDMHRRFEAKSDHLRLVNFYEMRNTTRLYGIFDGILVNEQSATLDRPDSETIGLHTSHTGLNKVNNAARTVVIHGLGGTGKTQLVLRYVETYRKRYDLILWIDARSAATVRSSFFRSAQALELPVRAYGSPSDIVSLKDDLAVNAVLDRLRKRRTPCGEWLVILDNADNLEGGIRDVIPSGPLGNIILTSRDADCVKTIPGGSRHLQVNAMTESESTALLLQHLKLDIEKVSQSIRDLSLSICDTLGYLALAVYLAGARIRAYIPEDKYCNGVFDPEKLLNRYLRDFKRHKTQILKRRDALAPYNLTVQTVWDTSLEALDSLDTACPPKLLLTFFAHLNISNIQEELFLHAAEGIAKNFKRARGLERELPEWLLNLVHVDENGGWDRYNYDNAIEPLLRFGLVQHTASTAPGVSMHSLVQWKAKDGNISGPHHCWNIWRSIFIIFAGGERGHYLCDPYRLQHVIAPHLPLPEDCLQIKGSLIKEKLSTQIGYMYLQTGQYKEGTSLLEQALEIARTSKETDDLSLLLSMKMLSSSYGQNGQIDKAIELCTLVFERYKLVMGQKDLRTLVEMACLAMLKLDHGLREEAEKLGAQAVKIGQEVVSEQAIVKGELETLSAVVDILYAGEMTPNMEAMRAHLMAKLAKLCLGRRRYDEAEKVGLNLLEIRRRMWGQDHPATLEGMYLVAAAYLEQRRWEEAEKLGSEGLEIATRAIGPRSQQAARFKKVLRDVDQGQRGELRAHFDSKSKLVRPGVF
ncbi:hypothetical protein NUW58_g2211 [Xylaria curta]|uniref:Uncharacterized protein n=1 Tax=Xylaria curta TaxID=42375 RepID=A0ACC1PIE8_9PEZI|nr:hypothetical protein NUW58_g2211 [Xylaria curta]